MIDTPQSNFTGVMFLCTKLLALVSASQLFLSSLAQGVTPSASPVLIPAAAASVTGLPATAPTAPPSTKVGRLPALGWNTWNAYHCDIDADKVLAAAQSFVDLGLKD
ncbi:hypothetical protein OF83DRAFT_1180901, partial [Amylostereum chailletii]